MALSTILVSGFELPDNLETTIRLNRTHETYTLVPESALKLGELEKPQVDDGEGNLEDLDGAYRVQMNPTCVPMQAKSVVIPIYFYPKDTCYPRKETLLRIKPVWLARYPYVENYPLPIPTEISDISGLSITLTGSDDWGYKDEPCDITAEQILTANSGLADELTAAASEMVYQDDPVAGEWVVEGVHYDGLSGVCNVNIVWQPEDDKTFAKVIVSKEMAVTDSRDVNLHLLKIGCVSYQPCEDLELIDSVSGNGWTYSGGTPVEVTGKVGEALRPAGAVNGLFGPTNVNIQNKGTLAGWIEMQSSYYDGSSSTTSWLYLETPGENNKIVLVVQTNNIIKSFTLADNWSSSNKVEYIQDLDYGWHHLAATWDGLSVCLYLDGEKVKEGNLSSDLPAVQSDTMFVIGRQKTAVDEVGLWNRVLGADEIIALYQAGVDGRSYNNWG